MEVADWQLLAATANGCLRCDWLSWQYDAVLVALVTRTG